MKNKTIISTSRSPKAIGPYSQAIEMSNFGFTSGQIPLDLLGDIISDDFEDQVRQCLFSIKGILLERCLTINNIIKLTVYVVDISNFDKLNKVFNDFLSEPFPARSVIEVSKLPRDSQVEIEAIYYNDH